jgi:hypothetical protein
MCSPPLLTVHHLFTDSSHFIFVLSPYLLMFQRTPLIITIHTSNKKSSFLHPPKEDPYLGPKRHALATKLLSIKATC